MRIRLDAVIMLFELTGLMTSAAAATSIGLLVQQERTAHYRLELLLGPNEKMFSPAEAAAQHPTSGEVMAGGDLSMMGMSMDMGDTRHLEVHVYSLDSGKVVTDASVAITVTGANPKKPETVPVAKMYGIKEGPPDTHYGNNVSLPPGNYTVAITVNGERAEFTVAIPGSYGGVHGPT